VRCWFRARYAGRGAADGLVAEGFARRLAHTAPTGYTWPGKRSYDAIPVESSARPIATGCEALRARSAGSDLMLTPKTAIRRVGRRTSGPMTTSPSTSRFVVPAGPAAALLPGPLRRADDPGRRRPVPNPRPGGCCRGRTRSTTRRVQLLSTCSSGPATCIQDRDPRARLDLLRGDPNVVDCLRGLSCGARSTHVRPAAVQTVARRYRLPSTRVVR